MYSQRICNVYIANHADKLKYRMAQIKRRYFSFLADRTNGRAYATVLRLSVVVCDVMYCG